MIRTILKGEPGSNISLIYANSTYNRIIFREQLAQLQAEYSEKLNVLHVISNDDSTPNDFSPYYKGQLSKLIVKKTVKTLMNPTIPNEFYLCGPYGFMETITEALTASSIDPLTIHREAFFIPDKPGEIDFANLPAREVIVKWNGFDRLVSVASGESILESALKVGIKLPHSCKKGACGMCRSQLISGEVKLRKNHILTEEEINQGQVLLCQGFAMSDNTVVSPLSR